MGKMGGTVKNLVNDRKRLKSFKAITKGEARRLEEELAMQQTMAPGIALGGASSVGDEKGRGGLLRMGSSGRLGRL